MAKRMTIVFYTLFIAGIGSNSYASNNKGDHHGEMMHQNTMHMQQSDADTRVSLNLMPQMKQHQLANMRSHMEAVRTIVGLIAESKFESASQVAYSELGLTEEMKGMCNSFENEEFKRLGLAFHKSGDVLGDVLSTNDLNQSLMALRNTMNYCVQCHAAFRQ